MANDLYNTYANYPCRDIPQEYMEQFILTFLFEASKDMGVILDKEVLPNRVLYIINKYYNHLPLSLIASACKRGGLGQYGAGRLVPRTVFGWFEQINQYFITIHENIERKDNKKDRFKELKKYPLGQAICWKIDHVSEPECDKIPLKELAEIIGRGQVPTLQYFGIIPIKTK